MASTALAFCAIGAAAQTPVNQTIPSSRSGTVEVMNISGRVRVVGWDRPEISITGTLGEGTDRLAVEGGSDRTTIRVVIPRNGRNVRGSDLEIRLPSGKDVSVRTTSAEIQVEGVSGSVIAASTSGEVRVAGSPEQVSASSTSGDVEVRAVTRTVRVNTTSGSITVGGTVRESVNAESVSGDVNVEATTPELAAKTVSGDLTVGSVGRRATASTVSGDVSIRGARMQYLSFESVSGDLHFEGDLESGASLNLVSHSGDIDLLLPGNVAADFQVSTFSGDIINDFGPRAQSTERYTPSKELRFSTGRGGLVAVKTFSGSVRLRRR